MDGETGALYLLSRDALAAMCDAYTAFRRLQDDLEAGSPAEESARIMEERLDEAIGLASGARRLLRRLGLGGRAG